MTSQADAASLQPACVSERTVVQAPSTWHRALMCPLKFLCGMIFCQTLAGSLLVVGWTYRLARRAAFQFWCARAEPPRRGLAFRQFMAGHDATAGQEHWPNWFARQNFRDLSRVRSEAGSVACLGRLWHGLVASLWRNFWTGVNGIVNTWVLTLPAGILWWFGWYDGWNNSFNKGYEQAVVGPLISILGIAWFIAVMFYVPLAQARQAVSGERRSFFEFRLIFKLARERWVSCLFLAAWYSLASLPLSLLKTGPMFWMRNSPVLETLTSAQVLARLQGYYFWCALVVLPAFVLLHVYAARIYAAGVLGLIQAGKLAPGQLAPVERDLLARLGLLGLRPDQERRPFLRFITWSGTGVGRALGKLALICIWFSFVAQIYITQFLNYHAAFGWLNLPLVQLPWFRYLPRSAQNPASDVFLALLFFLVALLIRSITRVLRFSVAAPRRAGSQAA